MSVRTPGGVPETGKFVSYLRPYDGRDRDRRLAPAAVVRTEEPDESLNCPWVIEDHFPRILVPSLPALVPSSPGDEHAIYC